jgi:hypothetical protein
MVDTILSGFDSLSISGEFLTIAAPSKNNALKNLAKNGVVV